MTTYEAYLEFLGLGICEVNKIWKCIHDHPSSLITAGIFKHIFCNAKFSVFHKLPEIILGVNKRGYYNRGKLSSS